MSNFHVKKFARTVKKTHLAAVVKVIDELVAFFFCQNISKDINRTFGQTSALFNVEAGDMHSYCYALNGLDRFYEQSSDLLKTGFEHPSAEGM